MTASAGSSPQVLSVVVPMWNEEALARHALAKVGEACRDLVRDDVIADHEIVVVDDGSTDSTPDILDSLAAQDPHLKIAHHESNGGLGRSLRTGFAQARGSLVLYMDADLPFDLRELRTAIGLVNEGAGVVSAYRRERTVEGPRRMVYSFVYNLLVRALFALRVRDVNFAFKLCRREVFDAIRLNSDGSFIDVELLVTARRAGFRIAQFGVEFFPRTRGISTLSSFAVITQILRELVRFRLSPARNQSALPAAKSPTSTMN